MILLWILLIGLVITQDIIMYGFHRRFKQNKKEFITEQIATQNRASLLLSEINNILKKMNKFKPSKKKVKKKVVNGRHRKKDTS